MNLTPSDITAITIAAGALLATFMTGIVNILSVLKTNKKVDDVIKTQEVIAGHVNSAATASLTKIEALQKEIESLKTTIAQEKTTTALLTQAAIIKSPNIKTTDPTEKKP